MRRLRTSAITIVPVRTNTVLHLPLAAAVSASRLENLAYYSFDSSQCGLTKTGIDFAAGVLLFGSWCPRDSKGLASG
jgi:hypothetical protein